MRQSTAYTALALLLFLTMNVASSAGGDQDISLPKPQTNGGKPLMEALQQRQTKREFKQEALSPQALGDLLWAAFGVNRPENAHRTAPSAMNAQEIDIYVALRDAVYLYDATAHRLIHVQPGDLRPTINSQPYSREAAVVLLYVANRSRMAKAKPEMRSFYAAFDAGCICQNVYLFSASSGLGSVVFDLNRPPVGAALKLSEDQEIIMAQAVGQPK